jgi:hypothetical protein
VACASLYNTDSLHFIAVRTFPHAQSVTSWLGLYEQQKVNVLSADE